MKRFVPPLLKSITRRETLWAASLIGVGIGIRVYAAWCFRHNLNLDAGVVTLMAKHMAEGVAFPVFFYGQPHMGSLEAFLGALYGKLFGMTGFAVCMGTVLVSIGLLPIVYRWARDAAGAWAGYAATAFILIGPGGFFHYNASPRGGYAAALTFGAWTLWGATRICQRWEEERRQSWGDYALLGLAAGLGWWSSQLTTAATLAAGIMLLLFVRGAVFHPVRLASGLIGFAVGSLPFWRYNVAHGWPSFGLSGSFGRGHFWRGIYWFFTDRFAGLMIPSRLPSGVQQWVLLLYVAVLMYAVYAWFRAKVTRNARLFITLSGIAVFTLVFAPLYAASHFAVLETPRYFLPMVAPIAVLLGIATAHGQRLLSRTLKHPLPTYILSALPLLLMVATQIPTLQWAASFERAEKQQMERVQTVGAALIERDIDIVYAANIFRSWIFALREEVAFVDVVRDFYVPQARRAERAKTFGVLENFGGYTAFLQATGGRADTLTAAGYRVEYHAQRMPGTASAIPIPPAQWQTAWDDSGSEVHAQLTDGATHTVWHPPPSGDTRVLTIAFQEPQRVSGVQLISFTPRGYPDRWRIEGLTDKGDWQEYIPLTTCSNFFWSGPRSFWGGPFYRMEAFFPPHVVTRLRITLHTEDHDVAWALHTVQCFTPEEPGDRLLDTHTGDAAIDALMAVLDRKGINRIYADRWESTQIDAHSNGRIRTTLDPFIFYDQPRLEPDPVRLDERTGLLLSRAGWPLLRRNLERLGVQWQKTTQAHWTLVHNFNHTGEIALRWVGFTGLFDGARHAASLLEHAIALSGQHAEEQSWALTETALRLNPHLYEAMRVQLHIAKTLNDAEKSQQAKARLRQVQEPDRPAVVTYPPGIQLLGISPSSTTTWTIGEDLNLAYHWTVPADLNAENWAVFVHFRRDRTILFQDDHVFLEDILPDFRVHQRGSPTLRVDRTISIPATLTPGPVEMVMGLYDRRNGQRLTPQTDLPFRRNSVVVHAATLR